MDRRFIPNGGGLLAPRPNSFIPTKAPQQSNGGSLYGVTSNTTRETQNQNQSQKEGLYYQRSLQKPSQNYSGSNSQQQQQSTNFYGHNSYGHPNQMPNGHLLNGHKVPLQYQPVVSEIQSHSLFQQQHQQHYGNLTANTTPTSSSGNSLSSNSPPTNGKVSGSGMDFGEIEVDVDASVLNGNLPAGTEGLPQSLVESMRTLFDILDDSKQGRIHLSDIESRWEADSSSLGGGGGNNGGKNSGAEPLLKMGVMGYLRKVTPEDGLLSFERFCAGLRLALLTNNNFPSTPNQNPSQNSSNNTINIAQQMVKSANVIPISKNNSGRVSPPLTQSQNIIVNGVSMGRSSTTSRIPGFGPSGSRLPMPNSGIPAPSGSRLPQINSLKMTRGQNSSKSAEQLGGVGNQQIVAMVHPVQSIPKASGLLGGTLRLNKGNPRPVEGVHHQGQHQQAPLANSSSLSRFSGGGHKSNGSLDNLKSESENSMGQGGFNHRENRPPSAPLLDNDIDGAHGNNMTMINPESHYPPPQLIHHHQQQRLPPPQQMQMHHPQQHLQYSNQNGHQMTYQNHIQHLQYNGMQRFEPQGQSPPSNHQPPPPNNNITTSKIAINTNTKQRARSKDRSFGFLSKSVSSSPGKGPSSPPEVNNNKKDKEKDKKGRQRTLSMPQLQLGKLKLQEEPKQEPVTKEKSLPKGKSSSGIPSSFGSKISSKISASFLPQINHQSHPNLQHQQQPLQVKGHQPNNPMQQQIHQQHSQQHQIQYAPIPIPPPPPKPPRNPYQSATLPLSNGPVSINTNQPNPTSSGTDLPSANSSTSVSSMSAPSTASPKTPQNPAPSSHNKEIRSALQSRWQKGWSELKGKLTGQEPVITSIGDPVLTSTTNSNVAMGNNTSTISGSSFPGGDHPSNSTTPQQSNRNVMETAGEQSNKSKSKGEVKPGHRKREAPRRHTVQSGIDFATLKRLKQLEQERDVLQQGSSFLESGKEWYMKQLQEIGEKIELLTKGAPVSENWNESYEERLNILGCRIAEVNSLISSLTEASEKLPQHINLAFPSHLSLRTITRLKEQNRQLTQEVSDCSHRVTQLEKEKAMLLRQLFHAKNRGEEAAVYM